jgi:hypothetical protein
VAVDSAKQPKIPIDTDSRLTSRDGNFCLEANREAGSTDITDITSISDKIDKTRDISFRHASFNIISNNINFSDAEETNEESPAFTTVNPTRAD